MIEEHLKRFFGTTYPLAKHFAEITSLFLLLLGCLYVVRHAMPLLFPPSETLANILVVVDAYASLLAIVGYAIWITLDMAAIVIVRAKAFATTIKKTDETI